MEAIDTCALIDVLEQQIDILEELAVEETALQRAVVGRDWPEAEARIDGLRTRAEEFASLEQERHRSYLELLSVLGTPETAPFPVALAKLDDATRRRLTDLYRRLKVSLFRVRSVSEGLDAFVATLLTTTRGILEELYPTRKGRMYGRHGRMAAPEDWALVVNRNL